MIRGASNAGGMGSCGTEACAKATYHEQILIVAQLLWRKNTEQGDDSALPEDIQAVVNLAGPLARVLSRCVGLPAPVNPRKNWVRNTKLEQ